MKYMIPLNENHLSYYNLHFEEPVFIEKLKHVQVLSKIKNSVN